MEHALPMPAPRLYTLKEAAAYLQRKPSTLYRWRCKKLNPIPHLNIAGRIFFDPAVLARFAQNAN